MTPYSPPKIKDVTIEYRLVTDQGRTPTTQQKRWFFEVPSHHVGPKSWLELVQRIFYDANVALRRREPSDYAWFYVDQVRVREVDPKAMLAWDGATSLESGLTHMPWMVSEARIVWEPSACFVVDDDGRYGVLRAQSFTQLVACREHKLHGVDIAGLAAFLQKAFPGEGDDMATGWKERLEALRVPAPAPAGAFRQVPGAGSKSGPPSQEDLGSLR